MKKLVKTGRPTKYNLEIIKPKIDEYLASCTSENMKLPTNEGLALFLNVNKDTLYEWSKKHPEFSDYLKKIADQQKENLINQGFYGGREVNGSLAIFLLKSIHGLKDSPNNQVNVQINVQPILGDMPAE
jgi:hypothetical protein